MARCVTWVCAVSPGCACVSGSRCVTWVCVCVWVARAQYLEPIFGSDDIMRQMPEEGKLFKQQDGMWRDNAKKVLKDVRCLEVANIPGLVDSYKQQDSYLETVQKGLNDYLEMKRLYFPRFFFLSNDEVRAGGARLLPRPPTLSRAHGRARGGG